MAASHPPQPVPVRLGLGRRIVLYALAFFPLYIIIAALAAISGGAP